MSIPDPVDMVATDVMVVSFDEYEAIWILEIFRFASFAFWGGQKRGSPLAFYMYSAIIKEVKGGQKRAKRDIPFLLPIFCTTISRYH